MSVLLHSTNLLLCKLPNIFFSCKTSCCVEYKLKYNIKCIKYSPRVLKLYWILVDYKLK